MPEDLVLDIDDDLLALLESSAAANGRSVEEEIRSILTSFVRLPEKTEDHKNSAIKFSDDMQRIRSAWER